MNETTLEAFSTRFGTGNPALVVSDDFGVELIFRDERMNLLFLAAGACDQQLRSGNSREVVSLLRKMDSFMNNYPQCRSMPLHSISVAAGEDAKQTFFQGATDKGVTLFAPLQAVRTTYGPSDNVLSLLLAGSSPGDNRYDNFTYADGIVLYIGETRTGPQQGQLVVQKIAIFRPK